MKKNEKPIIDNPTSTKKKTPAIKPIKQVNWPMRFLLFLLTFIIGAGLSIYFMPQIASRMPIVATWIGNSSNISLDQLKEKIILQESRLDSLSQQYAQHEQRLNQLSSEQNNDLSARLDALELTLSQSPSEEERSAMIVDNSQSSRIDMLLSRMSQLEASFIPLSKNMIDGAAAKKERDALSQQSMAMKDKITDLESRLLVVEAFASRDNSGLLLTLKVAQLKRKITSGNPYIEELRELNEMIKNSAFANNETINLSTNQLAEFAQKGLLTPYQLQSSFNDLIPTLLTASNTDSDTSWWRRTITAFNNMITVRKTDGGSYNDSGVDGLIRKIEIYLKNSDLKSALNILNKMEPAERKILEEWQSQLEAWLNSENAIEALDVIASENYLRIEKTTPLKEEASL